MYLAYWYLWNIHFFILLMGLLFAVVCIQKITKILSIVLIL